MKNIAAILLLSVLLVSCASAPPRSVDNICTIFKEKSSWYKHAKKAEKRWGSSPATTMAIMHQESRFRAKARPPRTTILGFIPGPRKSDAYGYSQAKDSTWDWYKKKSGSRGADRDKFADAVDFIAWYNKQTQKTNGVKLSDTYRLYLAYHEGHGGFARKTYAKKSWLISVAKSVSARSARYRQQLNGCEKSLSRGFSLWPFG